MKEYHVVGNQRVTGDFKLYVMFNNSVVCNKFKL